jgi:hypothetical protein
VEEIIQGLSKKGKTPAIVLDFSNLEMSSMETTQMADFVSIMSKNKFKRLFAIPPSIPESGNSQVVSLLNKSLPMFGENGIRVVIEDPRMNPLFYLYPTFL